MVVACIYVFECDQSNVRLRACATGTGTRCAPRVAGAAGPAWPGLENDGGDGRTWCVGGLVAVVAVVIVWPLGGLGPPVIAVVAMADIAAPSLLADCSAALVGPGGGPVVDWKKRVHVVQITGWRACGLGINRSNQSSPSLVCEFGEGEKFSKVG